MVKRKAITKKVFTGKKALHGRKMPNFKLKWDDSKDEEIESLDDDSIIEEDSDSDAKEEVESAEQKRKRYPTNFTSF